MSEGIWWDNDGNQWQTWHGENYIIGYDSSKKIARTPEQEEANEAIFRDYDRQKADEPIPVTPKPEENILFNFIQETMNLIQFREFVQKASGKEVKFED